VSWSWWNAIESEFAGTATPVLRVNVDETSIARDPGGGKGLIVSNIAKHKQIMVRSKVPARGAFTQVTFVCDNPAVQPKLPQVIIGNEHILTKRDLGEMKTSLPANVYLIRAKSSWVTSAIFAAALKWLRRGVNAVVPNQPIALLLDCSNVHLHATVLALAKRLNIHVCFVPTNLTWLLQPCDTHVFHQHKVYIRKEFARTSLQTVDGAPSTLDLLRILVRAIRHVLQKNRWATAFDQTGYGCKQQRLCRTVVDALRLPETLHVEIGEPNDDQKRQILPRKRKMDMHSLKIRVDAPFLIRQPHAKRLATGAQSSSTHASAVAEQPLPWSLRLRSRVTLHAPAAHSSPLDPAPALSPAAAPPCPSWMQGATPAPHPQRSRAQPLRRPRKPSAPEKRPACGTH